MDRRPFALLVAALLAACSPTGAQPARKLQLSACRPKGVGREAQCGTLRVFEDRKRAAGRTIDLQIVVLPSLSPNPAPDPLFLLAGGPGQGAISAFPPVLGMLGQVRKTRDLVLVDQRGTGGSRPLECALFGKDATLRERLEAHSEPEKLRQCAKQLDADPRFYTTDLAMDDLDDVRAALGYQRVNLLGGSYGTRAALIYARQHPTRVRSMVLDGVAPLALHLPVTFARDAQRALELLLRHCAEDAACEARFPKLRQRFDGLLARLEDRPAAVRVADPLTGAPADLTITRRVLVEHLRALLYSPELSALLPLTLERAEQGDWGPFVAQADALTGAHEGLALGMMLSVICAEDVPAIAAQEIERFSQATFLGGRSAQEFVDACKVWPHGSSPAGWHQPVRSDAPALLLSGELDPVTPPAWAEEALKTLPRGKHVVVPGVGHGTLAVGCVPDLIQKFLQAGSADGLDLRCAQLVKRPPFFLSFSGPRP